MRLQDFRTVKWTYSEERNKSKMLILTAMIRYYLYIAPIHAIKDARFYGSDQDTPAVLFVLWHRILLMHEDQSRIGAR
jgi:hypothetical protein